MMLPMRWMNDVSGSPFDGLLSLRGEIDRVLGRMVDEHGFANMEHSAWWAMPMDQVETDGEYEFVFEVPGFRLEDLDVTVEGRTLTVTGERRWPLGEGKDTGEAQGHHATERRYGRFRRVVTLPVDADVDTVDAACRDGLLSITVAKREDARPRRIEIGAGEGERPAVEAAS